MPCSVCVAPLGWQFTVLARKNSSASDLSQLTNFASAFVQTEVGAMIGSTRVVVGLQ